MTAAVTGAALAPGDFLPDVRLPDARGAAVPLHHQSIAGDPIVLLLSPRPIEAAREPALALAAAAAAFAALPAHAFVVSPSPPEAHRLFAASAGERLPGGWPDGVRLLTDPDRRLLAAFGAAERPAIAVLRPNLRIAALLDATATAEALALARAMLAEPARTVTAQAPVLLVDSVFPPAFCAALIDAWHRADKSENRVSNDEADYARESVKRRADAVIEDDALGRAIQGHLTRRLLPELVKALRFQVTEAERYRIGCYDAARGDYFRRHRDLGTAKTGHRAYALSLNLTDDYAGGEVLFPEYGRSLYRAPAGGALVFSCALLHEAMPVSRGRRFALFTFFSGRGIAAG